MSHNHDIAAKTIDVIASIRSGTFHRVHHSSLSFLKPCVILGYVAEHGSGWVTFSSSLDMKTFLTLVKSLPFFLGSYKKLIE